jgi:mono/diheme cytochrome c family protein
MEERKMKTLNTVVLTLAVTAMAGLGYVYSGLFDVAADQPHGALVNWIFETTREQSIAIRAKEIEVPNLDEPELIEQGADEYAEMCSGCHLAPGVADNEFRQGLNPPAPELAKPEPAEDAMTAAQQFWVVKHGIKMSAMPSWGGTHDDPTLWSIVAFLRKLPTLTAEQYANMTVDAESAHDEREHAADAE